MKAIILGIALLPMAVFAGEKIDQQIEVPNAGVIHIENQRGDIKVTGWDKNQFKVTGELDDKAQGYTLKTQGNKTQFIVKMPELSNWDNNNNGSTLTIFMPKSSALEFVGVNASVTAKELQKGTEIDVVNGAITVNDLNGDIKLTSVNGDIKAKALNGKVQFETVNGSIDDQQSSGEVRFSAVNGNITSNSKANDIRLENVNGDINFNLDAIKELQISTVNGEVKVRINRLLSDADVSFESVSGNAAFYFPADLSAQFEVEAHAGGKIDNQLTDDQVQKAQYGPASGIKFNTNGTDASVEMNTISGVIQLKRQ